MHMVQAVLNVFQFGYRGYGYHDAIHTVSQKKKLFLPEGRPTHVWCWRHTKQPTSQADFSYHIRIVGFLALKFQIFTIFVLFLHFS